jgi:hypothetical protein
VPWDDLLSPGAYGGAGSPSMSGGIPGGSGFRPPGEILPQTKLAYTALAGVLVKSLAATHVEPVPGRNLGEHAD